MRIPDCRNDEFYNEKYLIEDYKQIVKGYDIAVEQLECVLNTIDFVHIELAVHRGELEEAKEMLEEELKMFMEIERNELITSMIEDIDDDEYEMIKKKVDEAVND